MSIEYKAQEGQQNFRLILKTGIDFAVYVPSAEIIEYIKPDGSTGTYTGDALSGSESDGKIYFDFDASTPIPADGFGRWKVRARLTIASKLVYTQPVDWYVGEFER
jgi:hypothetical protein